jgi:hypothetical protein
MLRMSRVLARFTGAPLGGGAICKQYCRLVFLQYNRYFCCIDFFLTSGGQLLNCPSQDEQTLV